MISIKLLFNKDTAIRNAQRVAEELDDATSPDANEEMARGEDRPGTGPEERRDEEQRNTTGPEHHDFQDGERM